MRLVRLRAGASIGARTARYNDNLQSRTRTTLGPEIFGPIKFLESDALVDNLNV